jgi:hypothetical protein
MIKFGATLNTDGSGYWSDLIAPVKCKGLDIGYVNDEKDFAELRVYFDTSTWDVNEDGLIYTDEQFLVELKESLAQIPLNVSGITYSEQGMQGDDYVSLDVGKEFIDSLMEIAPEVFA